MSGYERTVGVRELVGPMPSRMNKLLVGIDSGLATFGYAVLCLPPDPACKTMRVDGFGCFTTKKATRKANVYATEDLLRRICELTRALDALLRVHLERPNCRVIGLAVESMSWPRSLPVCAKIGMSWGVIGSAATLHGLPVFQASPQAVKAELTGRASSSKEDVQAAVLARVPRANAAYLGTCETKNLFPKLGKKLEHPCDALAVALTCLRSDAVQAARRM